MEAVEGNDLVVLADDIGDYFIAVEEGVVNVGRRFALVFRVAFSATVVQLAAVLLEVLVPIKPIQLIARCVFALTQWVIFVAILGGVIFREQHTGQVCSGDFLPEGVSTKGYVIEQGVALKIVVYIWMFIACLTALICVCACFS